MSSSSGWSVKEVSEENFEQLRVLLKAGKIADAIEMSNALIKATGLPAKSLAPVSAETLGLVLTGDMLDQTQALVSSLGIRAHTAGLALAGACKVYRDANAVASLKPQVGGAPTLSPAELCFQMVRQLTGRFSQFKKLSDAETEFYQRVIIPSMGNNPEKMRLVRPFYVQHHDPSVCAAVPGAVPPDGVCMKLDGTRTTLHAALKQAGHLSAAKSIILLGSITCPVWRAGAVEILAAARAHALPLVLAYVYEAHVDDGWQIGFNPKAGFGYNYPKTNAERLSMAKRAFCDHLKIDAAAAAAGGPVQMVVDVLEGPQRDQLNTAFEAVPCRMYVLKHGKISWRSGPGPYQFDLDLFKDALASD